jgi:hypothetical protein
VNQGQRWRANVEHANAQQDNPHPAVWFEVTTFGSSRRRHLCAECDWTWDAEPQDARTVEESMVALVRTYQPVRRRWWRTERHGRLR